MAGELWRDGQRLKLSPQPLKVLICLARRSGELVTREELAREVWGEGIHVDFEHGLNFCIRQIRAALKDDVESPRFIETVPRRGYRFLPAVTLDDSPTETTVPAAPATAPTEATADLSRRVWIGSAVLILFLVAALAWPKLRPALTGSTTVGLRSLAILPIQNLNPEDGDDHIAEVLTEAVTAELTHLEGVRVLSRLSPEQRRGTGGSPAEAGQRLGVDAVLQGSFARFGDQVSITVKLIQVTPERYLWAQTYTRDGRDPLAWHARLAHDVGGEVSLKLRHPIASAVLPAASPAAEDYLQGQYFWAQQTSKGLLKAVHFFRSAIEKDPSFAPAYSGLADSYIQLELYGMMAPEEARTLAREAALKGLELDRGLAQAHEAIGFINLFYDWEWEAAEKECRRALEIDPKFARAYLVCAGYEMAMGRKERAIKNAHRAFEIEPASLRVNLGLIAHLYFAGQYDDAIRRLEDLVDTQPEMAGPYVYLGLAEHARKDYGSALVHFRKAQELGHAEAMITPLLAASHAAQGEPRQARQLLAKALKLRKTQYVSPFLLARVYEYLGETDKAFGMLDEAYKRHAREMIFLKTDPSFDKLRPDPRFAALVARLKLPE